MIILANKIFYPKLYAELWHEVWIQLDRDPNLNNSTCAKLNAELWDPIYRIVTDLQKAH